MPDSNELKLQRAIFYDRYWQSRDRDRVAARSRERAAAAVKLLGAPAGRRLLEVGCGPGWGLETFQAAGYRVIGVDVSRVAVEEARRRGVEARLLDIESESLEGVGLVPGAASGGDAPEVVVALEVLEHLVDPLGALGKMMAILAPGGVLAVSLPNEIALPARLQILRGRLSFGGHDDPHIRHFDRRRARAMFDAAGLEIAAEAPISLLPPRWALAQRLGAPLARWLPGCLSLAAIYRLEARAGGER